MGIDREAVYTPVSGQMLIIRGETVVGDSKVNAQWAFQMTAQGVWVPGPDRFKIQLTGRIIGANLPKAEDAAIGRQRESINRLLEHLKVHCPKLLGTGECDQIAPEGITT